MKIACLSGKGGAGKTFVAVNLAAVAGKCTYIDCDVEEPNGRLFLKPTDCKTQIVANLQPSFDTTKCKGCRKCVDFCKFNALVFIKNKPLLFSEICHSCGGCKIICPEGAVTEIEKPIGIIETGRHGDINVVTGVLNTGEASGVPVISHALKMAEGLTILDCPPGSACPVMESVMDADFCVLVAEPTAFGFHNFKMVYELVALLGRKCGVIINKQTVPYEPLESFCAERDLMIIDRLEYQPELAQKIAAAEIVTETIPELRERFALILEKIGACL